MILTKLLKEVMMEDIDYECCESADEYLLVTMIRFLYLIIVPCVIIIDIFLLPMELISIKMMKMKERGK